MADELVCEHLTGKTVYAVISNAAGQRWNTAGTPAFENHVDGNWTNYDVAASPQGTSGRYLATMPAGIIIAGRYYATFYEQAGGSPHITNDLKIGAGPIDWTGAAEVAAIEFAARVTLTRDNLNTQDELTARWFRLLTPLFTGITSPTIQVIKSDGTDLIAVTAMTQIGTTGAYRYVATGASRLAVGDAYLVRVVATIAGAARTFETTVSRDV